MITYQHTQPGTLIRWMMGIVILWIAILGGVLASSAPRTAGWLALSFFVLLVCLVLFHSLTVTLSERALTLHFGPGVLRKSFALSEIEDARCVRNRWYYGWGIRYTPHGWLWNVSGFDAVEIRRSSGKKFRIGTDDPEGLRAALADATAKASAPLS